MTKRRTSGPGRGQEEFGGAIGDAFGAAVRAERARRQAEAARARRGPTEARGGHPRGPLRPYLVGWRTVEGSYDDPLPRTTALGRTMMLGSSVEVVRARAARHCCKEAGIRPHRLGGGFEIRYIREIT